jgi:regulator of protease activity HflC (stomatin/prohibitin superfamily)
VINPISQSIVEVNQQTKILEYNQIGISRDNVQFRLTVVLFYRISDSLRLAYRLGSYDNVECIKEIATGTLRSVLG